MKTKTYFRMTSLVTYLAATLALVLPVRAGWAAAKEEAVLDGAKSLSWTQITPGAPWQSRSYHASVIFHSKLWILGGTYDLQHELNDVWSSSDGANWTEETANALWPARSGHGAIVFNDRMWILGGNSATGYLDDIWCSEDGIEWENALESGAWDARMMFGICATSTRIVIAGGAHRLNDVWSSSDGTNWIQNIDVAPWPHRDSHELVYFLGKLWVLGGQHYISQSPWVIALNDVWSSFDGFTWAQDTADAGWQGRGGHAAVVFKNRIWVLGGAHLEGSGPGAHTVGLRDVWSSPDGANWTQNPDAPWSRRSGQTAVVFNNKLWILGGLGYDPYGPLNDVWYAETDPNAAFSGTPVSGDAPLAVDFTDESTATSYPITDWNWDFGDGGTSGDQDPSHTYRVRGFYTVSLTVTSDAGEDTETKEGYITVYGTPHDFHTADQDQDNDISLAELLRIIQFYNSDGFHCETGTEDGYTPGSGDDTCTLHDGDYAPPDWQINLTELLRVIQFYNAAGYESCPDGEDGFCVVTTK